MITLVDSSVLLDVMAPSPWRARSEEHLAEAAELGEIAINQIVYAEVAVGFATVGRLERERPVPSASFRGELRHRLVTGQRTRPARLRLMIAAYAGSGLLLLLAGAASAAGISPLGA